MLHDFFHSAPPAWVVSGGWRVTSYLSRSTNHANIALMVIRTSSFVILSSFVLRHSSLWPPAPATHHSPGYFFPDASITSFTAVPSFGKTFVFSSSFMRPSYLMVSSVCKTVSLVTGKIAIRVPE